MTANIDAGLHQAGSPRPLMDEMFVRNWWVVGLRGVLAILLGIWAFAFPGATMLSLVLLFSAFAIVDGVFALIAAVRALRQQHHWEFLALQGVVSLLAGVAALLWPGLTVVIFVLMLAGWAIASGVLMIVAALRVRDSHRWLIGLNGILAIAFGAVLVIAPMLGAVVLTWWLGAFAVMFGISLIALAFALRSGGTGVATAT